MPPRKQPRTYVCIVCGAPATSRCPPCWDAGIVTPFCSRDHQKLVWFGHRDSCGDNACPFLPPPLTDSEIALARSCTKERGITEMRIKSALNPEMRNSFPSTFRVSVTDVRADLTPAVVDKNEAKLPLFKGAYAVARWYRELEEMQENGDLSDDEFSDEVRHLFLVLATLLYLGQKPAQDRPRAFKTEFIVDVVKRIIETLAPLNEVGQSTELLKMLRTWVKPVVNLQGEIGRGENGMTGRVEIYSVGR
ncbi:hypothetical protein JCM10908_000056 [Rhodotorula pacifica]|uniref:zinc finger MYND domain-containing protein n=1 Tax=Rhodotorula pacifica TaxID=1495444 RepID=UPI00317C6535